MSGFLADTPLDENRIERARRARIERGLPVLDLTDTNPTRNGFIFPGSILAEGAKRYLRDRHYTPDPRGLLSAREAISRYYRTRTPPLPIPPEQVVITASTSESYSLLFSLLADPGEILLAPTPSYPLFEHLAAHHRLQLRGYALRAVDQEGTQRWEIDESSVTSCGRTRGVIVVSPHNPTGMVYRERNIAIEELSLPIISDEVFAPFTRERGGAPPLGTFHPQREVFHLGGISKMFALPDLKLGWIALNDAAWKRFGSRLEFLNDTFLSANYLTQSLLHDLFVAAPDFIEAMRGAFRLRADQILDRAKNLPTLRATCPEGGASLPLELPPGREDEKIVLALLERHGILVHPGYFYGLESHLVLSLYPSQASLQRGIEALMTELND